MLRRLFPIATLLLLATAAGYSPASAQITPPAPGVQPPEALATTRAKDSSAYQFQRAWLGKSARVAEARRIAQAEGQPLKASNAAVSGVHRVPVFTLDFANEPQPYPAADLDASLFGSSEDAMTLTEFYDEISGSRVTMTGDVWGPTQLPESDSYYAGSTRGLSPGNAKLGEMMKSALEGFDGSVDFGQYDNDGPDGLPNSGDDDGYVDFVAFVHSEQGAECGGNTNIWSHRWVYSAWPASGGAPFQTNDPAAGGGMILVWDYTVQPALSCESTPSTPTPIEIGVFCHEFGHAFGLPDLYDTNGGAAGLGEWCLMASGNWNVPSSPAHMSAWCKRELGWVNTVPVTWQGAVVQIEPVETSGTIYELPFREDRWGRRGGCALAGDTSMAVGLSPAEIEKRGWLGSGGYGNLWRETLAHDFRSDGSGDVRLTYRYSVDTEALYDFALVLVEVDGVEKVVAAYDGVEAGIETIDLTGFLPATPADYRVKFRFVSDEAVSGEDGGYISACVPFAVDDVQVSGGGVTHLATFENHRHGWYAPETDHDNPVSEMWLVENRQPVGSDLHLNGSGLLVYHVDQEVLDSNLGTSGGPGNRTTRGIVLEEADGQEHLLSGSNRGDAGDPWPGTSEALGFDAASFPSSESNGGHATPIAVTDIIPGPAGSITATLLAGDPAPSLTRLSPGAGSGQVELVLEGAANVRHGASVSLVRGGEAPVEGIVEWLDFDRVHVAFDLAAAAEGMWQVIVENPDGQTAVATTDFEVAAGATATPSLPLDARLGQNYPNPFNPDTTIRFQLPRDGDTRLIVYDMAGRHVRTLVEGVVGAGFHEVRWDGRDDGGRPVASGLYAYRLESRDFSAGRTMMLVK